MSSDLSGTWTLITPILFGGSAFSAFNGEWAQSRSKRSAEPVGRVEEAITPTTARMLGMQRLPSPNIPKQHFRWGR